MAEKTFRAKLLLLSTVIFVGFLSAQNVFASYSFNSDSYNYFLGAYSGFPPSSWPEGTTVYLQCGNGASLMGLGSTYAWDLGNGYDFFGISQFNNSWYEYTTNNNSGAPYQGSFVYHLGSSDVCGGTPLAVQDTPPAAFVTSLQQYQSDGVTTLSPNELTTSTSVVFGGVVGGPASDSLEMQIEVESASTSFLNTPTATSNAASNGAAISMAVPGLADGNYHWQARTLDLTTGTSSQWVSFGNGTNPDFVVETHPGLPGQFDDSAQGAGTIYCSDSYQLGRGFGGVINTLTIEGNANEVYLKEFNDAAYSQLANSDPDDLTMTCANGGALTDFYYYTNQTSDGYDIGGATQEENDHATVASSTVTHIWSGDTSSFNIAIVGLSVQHGPFCLCFEDGRAYGEMR